MNYNDRDDMDMNDNLKDGDVSSGIGLINSHTIPQCNKYFNLNGMNWGFKNGDVSGGHYYMNNHTVPEAKNKKSIDSTKKSDENTPNRSEMEIMGYRMVFTLMLCYVYPHFINITICNTIMNIITS